MFDNDSEEYVATCPACGEPIDYCQGHGVSGDSAGAMILIMHDNGQHQSCHRWAECTLNAEPPAVISPIQFFLAAVAAVLILAGLSVMMPADADAAPLATPVSMSVATAHHAHHHRVRVVLTREHDYCRVRQLRNGGAVLFQCADGSRTRLRACPQEDSRNCYWNAGTSGNRVGHSFVDLNGHAYYVRWIRLHPRMRVV